MGYSSLSKKARDWAVSKVGCKYSQARRTQESIFDCSSLVARAYSAQGKAWKYGGRVPLSCYEVYDDDFQLIWPESYAKIGTSLGRSSVISMARQSGDLQFLNTMPTNRTNKITHVAMVASPSKIVHARGTAYGVRMDGLTHYSGKVCALVRYNPDCDLVYGHRGFRTAAMQKALNKHGADLNGDGEFGSRTLAALKAFQKTKGLPLSGRGDAATLTALDLPSTADPGNTSNRAASGSPSEPPLPIKGFRVAANAVNLRTGPGVGFDVVKAVGKGAVLIPVEADGWRPVLFGDDVCWINEKYIEEFST